MKKCALLAAGVLLAALLSACGTAPAPLEVLALPTPQPTSSGAVASGTASAVVDLKGTEEKDVEDTLEGLCTYLEGNYAVSGAKEEMSYGEIGAKGGFRYRFTYNNSTVQLELYEYDPKDLDEKGKACLDEVKEKGAFTILNREVPAMLSTSGKYLMVYSDPKNEEKNNTQKQRVEELFVNFKA